MKLKSKINQENNKKTKIIKNSNQKNKDQICINIK